MLQTLLLLIILLSLQLILDIARPIFSPQEMFYMQNFAVDKAVLNIKNLFLRPTYLVQQ